MTALQKAVGWNAAAAASERSGVPACPEIFDLICGGIDMEDYEKPRLEIICIERDVITESFCWMECPDEPPEICNFGDE